MTDKFKYFIAIVADTGRQAQLFIHGPRAAAQRGVLDHGQHAQRHAFPVVQPAQMVCAFNGVAQRMAEVQRGAQAGLPLVPLHHVLLHHQAAVDDLLDLLVGVLCFEQLKQALVRDQPRLHGLCMAVDEMALGQAFQRVRVRHHKAGLVKSAHSVFGARQVDGRFSADGGIDLRKRRGGAVDERNAPHIAGRGKARKVPYNAAAKRQHRVAAGKAVLQHHGEQLAEALQALGPLALRQHYGHALPALGQYGFQVCLRNSGVAYHQHAAVQVDQLPYARKAALLDNDVIAAAYSFIGDIPNALDYLSKAIKDDNLLKYSVRDWPAFENCKNDNRYQRIIGIA